MAKSPKNNFISIPDNNPFIRNPSAFGENDRGIGAETFAVATGFLALHKCGMN
ncbi:MAG: hypothetical protein HC908_02610 [Calothrix sp. SM1_7_51]|nr:hypothetical protein [Calothrix sp. SM1_7_51]